MLGISKVVVEVGVISPRDVSASFNNSLSRSRWGPVLGPQLVHYALVTSSCQCLHPLPEAFSGTGEFHSALILDEIGSSIALPPLRNSPPSRILGS